MKKIFSTIMIVLCLAALLVVPVLAMGHVQEEENTLTVFAILTAVFQSLMAAAGIGSALSFLIQLGKIWFPKWFPDNTSQNWRLGSIFSLTLIVYFVPLFYPPAVSWLNITHLDQLGRDFAEFGALIVPLFVAATDWASKKFYTSVLRGSFIGKSYTPTATPKPASK